MNRPKNLFEDSNVDSNISGNEVTVYYSCESAFSALDEQEKSTKTDVITSDTFICDTGSSCHLTNSMEGMTNTRRDVCQIKIGSGQKMTSTIIGTKKVVAVQKDGSKQSIMLKDCRFVPELWVNLFSVNKALSNGFKISNEGLTIKLKKKNTEIKFDRVYSTGTVTA